MDDCTFQLNGFKLNLVGNFSFFQINANWKTNYDLFVEQNNKKKSPIKVEM